MDTQQERAELKRKMPKTRLRGRHLDECKLLVDRYELLSRLPKNGVCAEIGAAFGDYTGEILARAEPARLHLIDAWESERYREGLSRIEDRFAEQISAGQVLINRGLSTECLAGFDDAYFDWVYIDTSHAYKTTWEELCLCDAKVKPGGRILGHDFCTGNVVKPVPYGVIEA
ncbi:MAG: class I SAM-dependent methyltransferase, partial [Candidatus Binatia bacterium]